MYSGKWSGTTSTRTEASPPEATTSQVIDRGPPSCPSPTARLELRDFHGRTEATMLGTVVIDMARGNHVREIVAEYRELLREVLGVDLDSVVVYGSQARGEATEVSDIDVLCIMKKPFAYGELVLRTAKIAAAVSLEHDVVISTTFVTREDYKTRNTPFLMNVRREASVI